MPELLFNSVSIRSRQRTSLLADLLPVAVKNILSIFAGLSHSVYHSSRYEELHSVRPGQIRPQPGAVQKNGCNFPEHEPTRKSVSAESQNHRKSQADYCLQIQFKLTVNSVFE